MHKIFGIMEDVTYNDREGAYIVPVMNNKIGVVQTPKGYFFLGGGLDNGESHNKCIERECLEEAGYTVKIGDKICSAEIFMNHVELGYFHPIQTYYIGKLCDKVKEPIEMDHNFLWIDYEELKGNMYMEMQNWALEQIVLVSGLLLPEIENSINADIMTVSQMHNKEVLREQAVDMLMMNLKSAEEHAEVEGWIDADDLERELEIRD